MELIRKLSKFGDVIKDAGKKAEPSLLTRFLMDLAQDFNKFYYEQKIIDAPEGDRNARLLLTSSVASIIKSGLKLLGIETPSAM
jgi:arginyl-tRNA synthetase